MDDWKAILERVCYALSSEQVREAYQSLVSHSERWVIRDDGELCRLKPYPMSFHPDFGRGFGFGIMNFTLLGSGLLQSQGMRS